MVRYLVIIADKDQRNINHIRRKDVAASYDIQYWGREKALSWAKDACAQTKNGRLVVQFGKGYRFL
jgi:hypothetical protein